MWMLAWLRKGADNKQTLSNSFVDANDLCTWCPRPGEYPFGKHCLTCFAETVEIYTKHTKHTLSTSSTVDE